MGEESPQPSSSNEQLAFEFPNPDDFPSYDEVDSEDGQAELPEDSFDESSVNDSEDAEACGCVQ